MSAQGVEMLPRLGVERIEQQRCTGNDALHIRILAVEYAQRVAGQAPLAVVIQGRYVRAEIGGELFAIRRARCRRSQRVHHQLHIAQSQNFKQPGREQNHFSIDIRTFESEGFRVDLMKLAIPSGLRALAPKHRSHAPDSQPALAQHSIRDHGTHDAGGRLGTQGDVIFTLIDEAEHLLFHDIREIADRAFEQLGLLDHGHSEFFVPIACENLARDSLQMLPGCDLRGQYIMHTAQGLDNLAQELLSAGGTRGARRRTVRLIAARGLAPRISAQDTVGAGLETRHIAREELRSDGHRAIVDFELHAAAYA
jgi:hypothetical protein